MVGGERPRDRVGPVGMRENGEGVKKVGEALGWRGRGGGDGVTVKRRICGRGGGRGGCEGKETWGKGRGLRVLTAGGRWRAKPVTTLRPKNKRQNGGGGADRKVHTFVKGGFTSSPEEGSRKKIDLTCGLK